MHTNDESSSILTLVFLSCTLYINFVYSLSLPVSVPSVCRGRSSLSFSFSSSACPCCSVCLMVRCSLLSRRRDRGNVVSVVFWCAPCRHRRRATDDDPPPVLTLIDSWQCRERSAAYAPVRLDRDSARPTPYACHSTAHCAVTRFVFLYFFPRIASFRFVHALQAKVSSKNIPILPYISFGQFSLRWSAFDMTIYHGTLAG